MRNLIRCPFCTDYKKTLGEILPNGMVAIQRHRGGYFNPNSQSWVDGDYTVVKGTFSLICGNCGKEVWNNDVSSQWEPRVYRFTLIKEVIKLGTPGSADYPGTAIRTFGTSGIS